MQVSSSVLISLHPRHAKKIVSGRKCLEFRRAWAQRPVSKIVIYCTVPLKRIVAVADVKCVHKRPVSELWELSKEVPGGLGKEELFDYFKGREFGFAIELGEVQRFARPLNSRDYLPDFRAPQSFFYLNQTVLSDILNELDRQRREGKVLFVGGVHGVGKTSLIASYASGSGVLHASAGRIISEAKGAILTGKTVDDIHGNQKILVDAVRRLRESGECIILDGHFSVLDANFKAKSIPLEVFSDLGIDEVVVLVDRPAAISRRIFSRDCIKIPVKSIESLQKLEVENAMKVADQMCIPFAKLRFGEYDLFRALAEKFIK